MGRWLSLAGIALALLYLEGFCLFMDYGNTVASYTKLLLTNEERAAMSTVSLGSHRLATKLPGLPDGSFKLW